MVKLAAAAEDGENVARLELVFTDDAEVSIFSQFVQQFSYYCEDCAAAMGDSECCGCHFGYRASVIDLL